jgi:hypothetical protein
MTRGGPDLRDIGYQFEPPCYDPKPPGVLTQGICAGEWINNITMYDKLTVPQVPAGEYVLGFRWVSCLGPQGVMCCVRAPRRGGGLLLQASA